MNRAATWQFAFSNSPFSIKDSQQRITRKPPMSTNIESHLIENRVFKPRKDFSKKAHISSLAQYEEIISQIDKKP